MTATKGKVIHLYQRDPQEALERLNRITGLRFSSWPQSLVNSSPAVQSDSSGSSEAAVQPDSGTKCGPVGMLSR
ncbi:hypothetical protein [Pseudomonas anguilliseptica]|uniref:Uncharacterized protein n=1 Tax=Pseudomonas anguilliseptica TaxID=53406 RepID=A0A1H5EI43_PSEAG|nr:hypothetical protein [Pseudomonas anguilliseptica]MCZ4323054.1 hypothetical protein [Pseudomonas anguilliseptica]SED90801.1 hypothetical protein SAMN05421553_3613 [Pseudomonas anguilliseptica]